MQRERCPVSVSSRIAATSSSSAASMRPFAAKTSAQQVPAEREQRDGVVRTNEVLEHGAPLLRALDVVRELAREHERAADVGEGLQARGFARRRRGHSLVEMSEPPIDVTTRDLREPELCKRAQLEVDVVRRLRHPERTAGKCSRLQRVT
jgi:hypothetical protein